MNRFLLAVSLVCISGITANADDFKVTSKLDSVKTAGYYKILLDPDIISYAGNDYADIRLINSKGIEIPYIFREEFPASSSTGFMEYNIIENEYSGSKKRSRIVIHNQQKRILSDLILVLRNSGIEKEITLKGSDNNKEWFIITKGYPVKAGIYGETAGLFIFSIPKSDYEYFEISTNDKKSDPIQIVKAGYYDTKIIQGLYTEVPAGKVSQTDSSNKKTYLKIEFQRPYEFSKIELNISGPDVYKRSVFLGYFTEKNNKRVFEIFNSYELSSLSPSIWETEKQKLKELTIIIENYDNSPLKADAVKFYQLNKYLIAKLDPGETYFVKAGNKTLKHPEYDLKYFANSISDSIQLIKTKSSELDENNKSSVTEVVFTKTILWIVIAVVVLLLGFFSIRMIREMGRNK